jgi:adenylate cyclase
VDRDDAQARLAELLLGPGAFTATQVAREADVDLALARRLWGALGFPPADEDERLFTRTDVEILRAVGEVGDAQSVDPADLVPVARVIGQALARVADAQMTAAADRLERLRPEAVPPEVAVGELRDRIVALAPALERFIGYVWRRHLLAALRRREAAPSASDRTLAVGFADLVGFTALSQALDSRELAALVDRFEAIAYEHVPLRGGRVVKMIGDEVMFAVEDGGAAADVAVALVEAHARESRLPDVRVGLARGPTLSWEGDLFGPTVNLANRLVNLARPGTVLVAPSLGETLRADPRFDLRRLRAVTLKGIGRTRPWVLRRAAAPATTPTSASRRRA